MIDSDDIRLRAPCSEKFHTANYRSTDLPYALIIDLKSFLTPWFVFSSNASSFPQMVCLVDGHPWTSGGTGLLSELSKIITQKRIFCFLTPLIVMKFLNICSQIKIKLGAGYVLQMITKTSSPKGNDRSPEN